MSEPEPEVTPAFAAAAADHYEDVVEAAERARDGAKQALADLTARHKAEVAGAKQAVTDAEQAVIDAKAERQHWYDLAGDEPAPPRIVVVRAEPRTAVAGADAPAPGGD